MGVLIAAAAGAVVGWLGSRKKKKAQARELKRREAARAAEVEAMALDARAAALTAETQAASLERTRATEAESRRYAASQQSVDPVTVQTGGDEGLEATRRRSYADPFGL